MTSCCIHAIVSGKVQGVFFRDCTQKKATALNITGWVKNLPDNTVELIACGAKQNINEFTKWLWQGSPNSHVRNVEWQEIEPQNHNTFEVRR